MQGRPVHFSPPVKNSKPVGVQKFTRRSFNRRCCGQPEEPRTVVTSIIPGGRIHLAITGAVVRVRRKMHKICSPLECARLRGDTKEGDMGRAILLWLLGVPIRVLIFLALLWH